VLLCLVRDDVLTRRRAQVFLVMQTRMRMISFQRRLRTSRRQRERRRHRSRGAGSLWPTRSALARMVLGGCVRGFCVMFALHIARL
jgi:hypothetical protein